MVRGRNFATGFEDELGFRAEGLRTHLRLEVYEIWGSGLKVRDLREFRNEFEV